jgi:hypothetical protein
MFLICVYKNRKILDIRSISTPVWTEYEGIPTPLFRKEEQGMVTAFT